MNIELKPLIWLKPYDKNAKLHPDEQINRLANTIKRFGWDQPIVADANGVIIKGHGRRLAAIKLGMTEVPVWIRDDLSAEEADAVRLADNATFGMQYDTEMMREELRRLSEELPEFNLDDLALTEKEKKFLIEDLDAPDMSAFMTDTEKEVEQQKKEDEERVKVADAETINVSKAFGFSKISIAEARLVNQFIAEAEMQTGKEGKEAVLEFMNKCLAT